MDLAGKISQSRLTFHFFHKPLEVARRQLQITVELAKVFELVEVDRVEAGVESVDHTRSDAAFATVFTADHANEIVFRFRAR